MATATLDKPTPKNDKAATFAKVTHAAGDLVATFTRSVSNRHCQHAADRAFHVNVNALMDAMILKRSNHLEPGAIADVSEPRVSMPAEVALKMQFRTGRYPT